MSDPSKPQVAPVPARPAPRLDEVRRLISRYSRVEVTRGMRTGLLAPPVRKRGD